jgi:hypothetical protein
MLMPVEGQNLPMGQGIWLVDMPMLGQYDPASQTFERLMPEAGQ